MTKHTKFQKYDSHDQEKLTVLHILSIEIRIINSKVFYFEFISRHTSIRNYFSHILYREKIVLTIY